MSIISLLIILCVLGLAAWLVNSKLPMVGWLKLLLNIVIFAIAVLICLSAFGILDQVKDAKVPRL